MTVDSIDPIRAGIAHALDSVAAKATDIARSGNDELAAREFEKLFLSVLVKEMRQSLPEGFFGKGPGASVYGGMFDEVLAESLAAGAGTGLRQAILENWNTDTPSVNAAPSEKALSENTTP